MCRVAPLLDRLQIGYGPQLHGSGPCQEVAQVLKEKHKKHPENRFRRLYTAAGAGWPSRLGLRWLEGSRDFSGFF